MLKATKDVMFTAVMVVALFAIATRCEGQGISELFATLDGEQLRAELADRNDDAEVPEDVAEDVAEDLLNEYLQSENANEMAMAIAAFLELKELYDLGLAWVQERVDALRGVVSRENACGFASFFGTVAPLWPIPGMSQRIVAAGGAGLLLARDIYCTTCEACPDDRRGGEIAGDGRRVVASVAGVAVQARRLVTATSVHVPLTFGEPQRNAAGPAGEVFRDCEECPWMVVLPGGGLAVGRYEVTVGEYRAFVLDMEYAPRYHPSALCDGAVAGRLRSGESWSNPGFLQSDSHPVTCVSFDDAQEYVRWLNLKTGGSYRLPTVAELVRASPGETMDSVACVNRAGGPLAEARESAQLAEGTCPVGHYGLNAAGVADMAGNVMEWTADCPTDDLGLRCDVRMRGIFGRGWSSLRAGISHRANSFMNRTGRNDATGFRVVK